MQKIASKPKQLAQLERICTDGITTATTFLHLWVACYMENEKNPSLINQSKFKIWNCEIFRNFFDDSQVFGLVPQQRFLSCWKITQELLTDDFRTLSIAFTDLQIIGINST